MKKLLTIIAMTFLGAIVYFSCAPKEIPATMPEIVPEGKATETKSPSGEPWQQEWESTLALARKEGKVTIYTGMGPETRIALTRAFKEKTGLALEITGGRVTELVEKIKRERKAGLFITDIYMTGPHTAWAQLKPEGALEKDWGHLLFLPEVLDPKVWWGGELMWMDKDRTFIQFFAQPSQSYWINSDLVRPGEITSFKDFLNPKWKGKIVLNDPSAGQSGTMTLFYIARHVLGWDVIHALDKQEPIILRDERLQVEWVARGKYAINIGSGQTVLGMELKEMGLPLESLELREGQRLSQGHGAFTLLTNALHANAAKLFLNWALTREGQTVLSKGEMQHSARLDAPTDFLPEWKIRKPGVDYFNSSTEEFIKESFESRKKFAEIFGIR